MRILFKLGKKGVNFDSVRILFKGEFYLREYGGCTVDIIIEENVQLVK